MFVATEANTVFAYDADSATATTPLWMKSLGTPMRTYPGIENQPVMPPNTVSCRDMYPQTGITSTPVIDRAAGKMYVVSKNFEGNVYTQRLHVLDVLTGQEMSGSPVNITGSVPGTALDGNGTTVPFNPQHHLNRPGPPADGRHDLHRVREPLRRRAVPRLDLRVRGRHAGGQGDLLHDAERRHAR